MGSSSKIKEIKRRMKNAKRDAARAKKENERLLGIVGSNIPTLTVQGLLHPVAIQIQKRPQPQAVVPETESTKFIKKIANNVWKLHNKVFDADGEPKDGYSKIYRSIEAIEDALKELGVTIKGHDGEAYDTGLAVNVVAWEKREGALREEIIETIKPTIRLGDKLLQWADVVAVTPVAASSVSAEPLAEAPAGAPVTEKPSGAGQEGTNNSDETVESK